jgi:hypothetical protein
MKKSALISWLRSFSVSRMEAWSFVSIRLLKNGSLPRTRMPSLSLLYRSAWNVSHTCRVSDRPRSMFSRASRSAWRVVKASEVATRATTSRLVNRRIFWVSPMVWASRR